MGRVADTACGDTAKGRYGEGARRRKGDPTNEDGIYISPVSPMERVGP